jgi:Pheromone A receptor
MQSGYPELPVLAFIAAVLVLIPLPRQIRARNIASIAMILWFFEYCLVSGVNAIVWSATSFGKADPDASGPDPTNAIPLTAECEGLRAGLV